MRRRIESEQDTAETVRAGGGDGSRPRRVLRTSASAQAAAAAMPPRTRPSPCCAAAWPTCTVQAELRQARALRPAAVVVDAGVVAAGCGVSAGAVPAGTCLWRRRRLAGRAAAAAGGGVERRELRRLLPRSSAVEAVGELHRQLLRMLRLHLRQHGAQDVRLHRRGNGNRHVVAQGVEDARRILRPHGGIAFHQLVELLLLGDVALAEQGLELVLHRLQFGDALDPPASQRPQ